MVLVNFSKEKHAEAELAVDEKLKSRVFLV